MIKTCFKGSGYVNRVLDILRCEGKQYGITLGEMQAPITFNETKRIVYDTLYTTGWNHPAFCVTAVGIDYHTRQYFYLDGNGMTLAEIIPLVLGWGYEIIILEED